MKTYQRLFIFTLLALATALLSPWAAAAWTHLISGRADWQDYQYPFSRIFSRFFVISGIELFIVFWRFRKLGSLNELSLKPLTHARCDILLGAAVSVKLSNDKRFLAMTKSSILSLAFLLFLAFGTAQVLHTQSAAPTERQKIEALIKYVGEMNGAKFVRNGSTYDAKAAATFVRLKWGANDSEVKTARDFIDKVANFSATSGKPYIIRFKDGSEMTSRDVLLAALNKIEKP